MAPEEALGSGGWGERRKHQKRSTQGGAAQRCLKRLMWVDPLERLNERVQKTRQRHADFPWTAAVVSLFTSSGRSFCRYCGVYVTYEDATMTAVKQMETSSHHRGATPTSKRQEVTAEQ